MKGVWWIDCQHHQFDEFYLKMESKPSRAATTSKASVAMAAPPCLKVLLLSVTVFVYEL